MITLIHEENNTLYIECPKCENWEVIDTDYPRHKLQNFTFLEWANVPYNSEISINKCNDCGSTFHIIWDYHNAINVKDKHKHEKQTYTKLEVIALFLEFEKLKNKNKNSDRVKENKMTLDKFFKQYGLTL